MHENVREAPSIADCISRWIGHPAFVTNSPLFSHVRKLDVEILS